MYRLFIDDLRDPPDASWTVARSSSDANSLLEKYGCPDEISFDHDLGGEDTTIYVVRWLIERDLNTEIIPEHFLFTVHSANPVGAENIRGLLGGYLSFRRSRKSP